MADNQHVFNAVRGNQAGRHFYIGMCSWNSVATMFSLDADALPEKRAQRTLRKVRIPKIRDYILQNPKNYVFSSITASVDGKILFNPMSKDSDLGTISISQNSTILINDGQHRVSAIRDAIKDNQDLKKDHISVVFFEDQKLERSQQMFADLNKHALKPTKSLGILYDHRNDFASFVVEMINEIRVFRDRIELEKTSISNRSTKFFTLSGLASATKQLLGKEKHLKDQEKEMAIKFWNTVSKNIHEWDLLLKNKTTPYELRTDYIIAHTNTLEALCRAGHVLIKKDEKNWRKKLGGLQNIDWSKNNPEWQGNLMAGKKMSKKNRGYEQSCRDHFNILRGPKIMESVFKSRTLDDIHAEIQEVYLSDRRPWILGFSGGKDSTCMIQIIWNALAKLPQSKLTKMIYIISSDTLVESPKIVETVMGSLQKMESSAKKSLLPIQTNLVRPVLDDTFWVCMIGKGYPAPSNTFRWCTDRLKIKSANRFIEEKVSEHGEIVMCLGSRKAESSTRAQVINRHSIKGSHLSHHNMLPQAFIYAPLQDFTTDDVWNYLLQSKKTPWGSNNRDLLSMYQDANAAECPLVVDTSTSSCGNSRFGCWVCTVVEHDKSMESMIDNGEDWMEPLLELRQMLKDTQDPEKKKKYRDLKHRNGRIIFWQDKVAYGPYKFSFCKTILEKLLEAQNAVQKNGPDPNITLIHEDELHEIQRLWRVEHGDWKNSVYSTYKKITGKGIDAGKEDLGTFGHMEQNELAIACKQENVPYELMARSLQAEFDMQKMTRRQKIHAHLEKLLAEEWRDDMGEAVDDAKEKRNMVKEAYE